MKDSVRGGIVVSVILFALVVYYFVWVYQPPEEAVDDTDGGTDTAISYLERIPEIPSNTTMALNRPAPDFAYYTINGEEIRLSDYIGVKPVVLDFWGTWCGPCMAELPVLQEFYSSHSGQVEIIAVTDESRRSASTVAQVVRDKGLTFKVIHDPSQAIRRLYPSRGVPYVVFVDIDGVAIDTHTGYDPRSNLGEDILGVFGLL